MKPNIKHQYLVPFTELAAVITTMFISITVWSDGIPEPGLAMYGSVSNTLSGGMVINMPLVWQVTSGKTSLSVTSKWVVVNSQSFYVTQVPFETRSIPGATITPSLGAFELTAASSIYVRSPKIGTSSVLFVNPAQTNFAFSSANRGSVERVDLMASIATTSESYEQWAMRLFGRSNNRNEDPDRDDVTNYAEYRAGTDPNNAESVFAFINVKPIRNGGVVIEWASVAQKRYTIERTESLNTQFVALKTGIVATPPANSYIDSAATGPGPFIYRLRLEE